MKKRIITGVLAVVLVLSCCAFTTVASANTKNDEAVVTAHIEAEDEILEEVEPRFTVEPIEVFEDPNMENYTVDELNALIARHKQRQQDAHELAEEARALIWPEDSHAIEFAQIEWWNSQKAIVAYNEQLEILRIKEEEEKAAAEKAIWEARAAEYPAATEIWLYMKDLGWSDYVCAGIMGNLMAEVGGQTLDIQWWLSGNGYYGMCQWNKAYRSGVWGADLQGQCDFLRDTIKYEIDTFGYAYKKGFNLDSFLAMTNERDAALAFAKTYERCGSGSYSIRQQNATAAYEYFVG